MARDIGRFTMLGPTGDDDEARLFAEAELQRLASRLDESPPQPPPAQSKVYTAYLFPSGGPGYATGHDNDPALIHFPYADEPLLAATMRREVEHLYATGGTDRVDDLRQAIFAPSRLRQLRGDGPPALRDYPNIVPFPSIDADRAACELVLAAWKKASSEITARSDTARPEVQRFAQEVALRSLFEAREQILAEAATYLDGGDPETLLTATGTVRLRAGKHLTALIDTWRGLQQCREAVLRATNPEAVNEAASYLTLRLSLAVIAFPVLHRMWFTDQATVGTIPPSVQVIEPAGGEPILMPGSMDGYLAITAFQAALVATLRTAWTANTAFTATVRDDPAHVWRYPPLIGRTLEALDIANPSVDYRAAQDRLVEEQGITWVNVAGLATAALTLGAGFAGAAPPVGLTLAILGAALSLLDVTLDYLKRREQDAAHHAVLDPRLSVASEPGYVGLLVGVAFAVLDLKGVRDALLAARAANVGRQAAGLVEMAAP